MYAVELKAVVKRYGAVTALNLERLAVEEREFFVIVGPSGSGKTTLLRILAGLVRPDSGRVLLGGADAHGVPPHARGIGFVFQGMALWPHLTVRGNIALGLRRSLPGAGQRRERIEAIACELGIESFLDRKPALLSGGERQRVALARALAPRPRLMLLDEPFSDLDARLRRVIARLVRRLHDRHETTTLLITHDRTDAHMLADRIAVLRLGRMVACGRPEQLHSDPGNGFTAEFLTDAAILSGEARLDGTVRTALGRLALAEPAQGPVRVAVRPEEIVLGEGAVEGRVVACEFAGDFWRCRIAVGETEIAALNPGPLAAGTKVRLAPPASPRRALGEPS